MRNKSVFLPSLFLGLLEVLFTAAAPAKFKPIVKEFHSFNETLTFKSLTINGDDFLIFENTNTPATCSPTTDQWCGIFHVVLGDDPSLKSKKHVADYKYSIDTLESNGYRCGVFNTGNFYIGAQNNKFVLPPDAPKFGEKNTRYLSFLNPVDNHTMGYYDLKIPKEVKLPKVGSDEKGDVKPHKICETREVKGGQVVEDDPLEGGGGGSDKKITGGKDKDSKDGDGSNRILSNGGLTMWGITFAMAAYVTVGAGHFGNSRVQFIDKKCSGN